MFERRLPCVSIAAFGKPAVPLVKAVDEQHTTRDVDVVGDNAELERGKPGSIESRQRGEPGGSDDDGSRTDLAELVLELARRAGGIERNGDEAGAERGEVRRDEVPVGAAQDADTIAGLEAEADEPRSKARDLLTQRLVGGRAAAAEQRHVVVGMSVENAGQVQRTPILPPPATKGQPGIEDQRSVSPVRADTSHCSL